MANEAHVAKKYCIEYGVPHFKFAQEAINRLLFDNCDSFCCSDEDVDIAEHIEVSREDLRNLIESIEANPSIAESTLADYCIINEYSFTDVVKCFKQWIRESDPANSFIVVDWF